MMRGREIVSDQRIAICSADKTIEQTVPVDVAAFLSLKKETGSAKAMNSRPYARQFVRRAFNGTDGAQTRRMKDRGGDEQHRVENVRRTGNGREPS